MVREITSLAVYDAGLLGAPGEARENSSADARRRNGPVANRDARSQSALLEPDQSVRTPHGSTGRPQYFFQRQRTDRLPPRGSPGLLPANANGCARPR